MLNLRRYNYAIILYCIAALLFFLIADKKQYQLRRLNALSSYADYPIKLSQSPQEKTDSGKLRAALRYYMLLSLIYKDIGRSDEMAGYCYYLLNDNNRSLLYLSRALKLHPKHAWVLYNRGLVRYLKGDYQKALEDFMAVINDNINDQQNNAILAPLTHLAAEQRIRLYGVIPDFIALVREKALRMSLICSAKKQENLSADMKMVLHPWAYVISPGKELLL